MAFHSGIQGLCLEVTVISCHNLEDKAWLLRQDPYVCVQYENSQFKTRTCTDGGKNPSFQEKFILQLIEGLQEVSVSVWNSNTVVEDDHIGSARVLLQKVLSQGYDDTTWPLLNKYGRHSGQIQLVLHFSNISAPMQQPSQLAPQPVYQQTTPVHYSTIPPSTPVHYSTIPPSTPVHHYSTVAYSAPQPPPIYPTPAYSHAGPASPFPSLQQTSYPPQLQPHPQQVGYLPQQQVGYPPQPQQAVPGLYPQQQQAGYPPQQLALVGYPQHPNQAGYRDPRAINGRNIAKTARTVARVLTGFLI